MKGKNQFFEKKYCITIILCITIISCEKDSHRTKDKN